MCRQALGHRLAGSCLNLGIQALGQAGRNMELAARQGELAHVRKLDGLFLTIRRR
jgi:HPt (histidine-containing phosphotransfer) domain-containing protein